MVSHKLLDPSKAEQGQIAGRDRLGSGLRRYLIVFDPRTFVLDQWKYSGWLLSLLGVCLGSKDFTPRLNIPPAPSTPVTHYYCPSTTEKDKSPIPMSCAREYRHQPSWGKLISSQYSSLGQTIPRRHIPTSPNGRTEPILFPKLAIYFADFPHLHSSSNQRLLTLGT